MDVELYLTKEYDGMKLTKCAGSSFVYNYKPELDLSLELDPK